MAGNREKIDDIFRDELWGFEDDPRDKVWHNISERISTPGRKRSIVILTRAAAVMALLLSVGIGYYFLGNRKNSALKQTAQSEKVERIQHKDGTGRSQKQSDNPASGQVAGNSKTTQAPPAQHEQHPVKSEMGSITNVHEDKETYEVKIKDNNIISAQEPIRMKLKEKILAFRVFASGKDKHATKNQNTALSTNDILAYNAEIMEEQSKKGNISWSVGGQVSPVFSTGIPEIGKSDYDYQDSYYNWGQIPAKSPDTEALSAYSGGINVKMNTGNRIILQSGIYYSKLGQHISNLNLINSQVSYSSSIADNSASTYLNNYSNSTQVLQDANTKTGSTDQHFALSNDNRETESALPAFPYGNITHYYEYLEIPIMLHYKMMDRKMDIHLLSGISTGLLIGNNASIMIESREYELEPEDSYGLNTSSTFGVSLEYPLSNSFMVSLEPSMKYYFITPGNNSVIDNYPLNFGIFTGLSYRF